MNFEGRRGSKCIQFTDPRSGIQYALKATKENQDWKLVFEVSHAHEQNLCFFLLYRSVLKKEK